MKKVIVLGSLNMDLSVHCLEMPRNGETINGSDFFMNPGGKGGNQAVAAAKLGASTSMIANVGNDVFGKEILSKLQEYGVQTNDIDVCEQETTGVAIILRSNHDNRIVLGNGANHTLTIDRVKAKLDQLASPGDIFLTQLENKFEVVVDALAYAKSIGLYTILNPAPARVLDEACYANIDLVVVNQSECQLLTGIYPEDEETSRMALDLFKNKGTQAIITLGTHGSIATDQESSIFIPSSEVETIDTTAAGDSYIGALCAMLAQDHSMKDALGFASRVAALTVTKRGAQIAIPYLHEVDEYFKEEKRIC